METNNNAGIKESNFFERLAAHIVDNRVLILVVALILAVVCAFTSTLVETQDRLEYYLPKDTETRKGLDLMDEEFTTYATAQIMVDNVTYDQASQLLPLIEGVDGVKEVEFDDTEDHYADAAALFLVTFRGTDDEQISIDALGQIEIILNDYDISVNTDVGNPLKTIIDEEMLIVDGIAFLIIVLVLFLTSRTYGEIPVLLLTFGAAAILNMGTNFLFGEISFVSDSIAIVMQLALAIDYAIILCHRFLEEHETKPAREAAIQALSKAIPEVSGSSLTTIAGLLALTFMQYKLGLDLGMVLIKAILFSLCSVFLVMPGLLVIFSKWIDRSHHKSFIPQIPWLGKFSYATRFLIPILFFAVVIGAFVLSGKVNYVYDQYSIDSLRQNESQIAKDKIEDTFHVPNQFALIIPRGDSANERAIIEELKALEQTTKVTGLADIEASNGYMLLDELNAREFSELLDMDIEVAKILYTGYAYDKDETGQALTNIDGYKVALMDIFDYLIEKEGETALELDQETRDDIDEMEEELEEGKKQMLSENWSRIVLETDLDNESPESYELLNIIHGIAARYYDDYYVVGTTTSCRDLKDAFETDNSMITILSIVFVVIVLILTFKSGALPVLLILTIQGSVCINFTIPYLKTQPVYFLTYLIISAIQMGANIDYAIVISSRYLEARETKNMKEAMMEALSKAFPTVITSGAILAGSGVGIGFITSNETISAIGVYLGQGTFISILLVLCVLPQILLLGDAIIQKTSFNLGMVRAQTARQGTIRLDGHVHGMLVGQINAEVHGTFRGEIKASVDVGGVQSLEEEKSQDRFSYIGSDMKGERK